MKSPAELRRKLKQQWYNNELRVQRLLYSNAWPIELTIGKPAPRELVEDLPGLRRGLQSWRAIEVGQVVWEPVRYRDAADTIELPLVWRIHNPSEWIASIRDEAITHEFRLLGERVAQAPPLYHETLIRQKKIVQEIEPETFSTILKVCDQLEPGCADGKPLRALAIAGTDSKFFERHRTLLSLLLDLRFQGEVSDLGLETFLDASDSGDRWLLVAPLQNGLLPFEQMRIRARELQRHPLPGHRCLIVENEQSLHQLPPLEDTVAILGAGLHVQWMESAWLRQRQIGYWGDIDTWGLSILAKARELQPTLTPLLMDDAIFYRYQTLAVAESRIAGTQPPAALTEAESQLYRTLTGLEKGRLEQEFIPGEEVEAAVRKWVAPDAS